MNSVELRIKILYAGTILENKILASCSQINLTIQMTLKYKNGNNDFNGVLLPQPPQLDLTYDFCSQRHKFI